MLVKWKCKVSVNRVLFAFDFETRRREDYGGGKTGTKKERFTWKSKIRYLCTVKMEFEKGKITREPSKRKSEKH